MTAETCTFTIEGGFITTLARSLWADERNPNKATHLLHSAFPDMREATVLQILTGEAKLAGDSSTGISVEPDDQTHTEHGNSLSLAAVLGHWQDKFEHSEDLLQMATGQTEFVPSPEGLVEVPRRRCKFKGMNWVLDAELKTIPYRQVDRESRRDKYFSDDTNTKRARVDVEPAAPPPPPLPERAVTTSDGWLSPEGKFYRCQYGQHNDLALSLGFTEYRLERLGWVKVQNEKLLWDFGAFTPTQAQIDTVFDYCRSRGEHLPAVFGGTGDQD